MEAKQTLVGTADLKRIMDAVYKQGYNKALEDMLSSVNPFVENCCPYFMNEGDSCYMPYGRKNCVGCKVKKESERLKMQ